MFVRKVVAAAAHPESDPADPPTNTSDVVSRIRSRRGSMSSLSAEAGAVQEEQEAIREEEVVCMCGLR